MKKLLIPLTIAAAMAASVSVCQAAEPVTVTATEFSFTPNVINLQVGQSADIVFNNGGALDHDMKSDMPITDLVYVNADNDTDEQDENSTDGTFDVDFNKGDTAEVTFTPTTAGTYQFRCDEPGHTEAGMVGTFVVSD